MIARFARTGLNYKTMNTITMIAIAALCVVPVAAVLLSLSRLARNVDDAERGEPLK